MLELNANILWNFVNFIVLCLLLKKFLFQPVLAVIEKRENDIKEAYALADSKIKEADSLKEQYTKTIISAKGEAEEIMKTANLKAQMEYDSTIKKASTEAARLLSMAEETIAIEKEKALISIQSDIADIAIAAAEKAADNGIDETVGRKLIEGFLEEAGAIQ